MKERGYDFSLRAVYTAKPNNAGDGRQSFTAREGILATARSVFKKSN
ncbi:MAG: hypothetical protein JMDDDDMK_00361 [Acidobacteria bacterium]|nr:hypothetical protein [Acidobacteriota bacterium]